MLAADESRSLAAATDCCTLVLSTTFQLLKLKVIWRTGKTECLVQMVGRHVRDIVEWRRDGGSLSVPVPQCGMKINVVDRYRHLGTIVTANDTDVPNARLRAKSAKEACGPLALRIFWSGHFLAPLKLSLFMSLVESLNSFSMHIAPPSFNALRIVAYVYNRVLRRIAGTPRFERRARFERPRGPSNTEGTVVWVHLDARSAEVRETHCWTRCCPFRAGSHLRLLSGL